MGDQKNEDNWIQFLLGELGEGKYNIFYFSVESSLPLLWGIESLSRGGKMRFMDPSEDFSGQMGDLCVPGFSLPLSCGLRDDV